MGLWEGCHPLMKHSLVNGEIVGFMQSWVNVWRMVLPDWQVLKRAPPHVHRPHYMHSLDHPWLSCDTCFQQFRQETGKKKNSAPHLISATKKVLFFELTCMCSVPHSCNFDLTSLPVSCKQFKKEEGKRKQTEQMLWNGKSDHFTSHLFCLPVYCCKAGVQRSRCLAKHEGAVPLSLWGWLSLLSLLMHRHDSCLISWSC